MPQPPQFPAIPDAPVQEGARWRHHRPSSDQVAAWFATQPLDEGMQHASYVGGVVLIPQSEKVRYTRMDGTGTVERYEQVFTPYVQIGTRLGYFRHLAEHRGLVSSIEPEPVPRANNPQSLFFNGNMPEGLWWHVVTSDGRPVRYLCATARVSLYEPASYAAKLRGEKPMPVLTATGTKQVGGGADANGLMKAQTGAIGRALGVAGILVVGTGVASAEDMQEFAGAPAAADPAQLPDALPTGPPPPQEAETREGLLARVMALRTQMQETDEGVPWRAFLSWWTERSDVEGWKGLENVPDESLKGVVAKMERVLATPQPTTNQGEHHA